jgi:hypothetical protein
MRRSATNVRPQNGNGHASLPSLEAAEFGQFSPDRKPYNGHGAIPMGRRRRKVTTKSLSLLLRRLLLSIRRDPQKMYICIGASFVTALLISLIISASLHQSIGRSDTRIVNQGNVGSTIPVHAPLLEVKRPSFEILFKGVKPAEIKRPRKFSREEFEEGSHFDFGDLEISFFEENGDKRNILHNWNEDETDYRPPTQVKDDDVDT